MNLHIYIDGNFDGKGTHMSAYLNLMKGPHDDKLKQSGHWPLRGTFTIELLDQLNDNDHHSDKLTYGLLAPINVTTIADGFEFSVGYGISQFISHDILLHHNNSKYLKDDKHTLGSVINKKFSGSKCFVY